jgi:hypothetical protein
MPDPEGRFASAVPDAEPLAELTSTRCLILIGEPGLGKTTSMRAEHERVRATLPELDGALFVELGGAGRAEQLREEIFGSPEFLGWREGEGHLHLFLDSLDEARLRIEHAARLLLRGLDAVPHRRLSLRLSCRSADRQHELERELRGRFGARHFAVRELAPLRRADVRNAAAERGLDAERILAEVDERELAPLAMVPETLNFLLIVAGETGALPPSRREAFEQGLLLLAREPDEERRDERTRGRLSAGARLAICARVAGAMNLSGRSAVRIDDRPPGPDDTTLAELSGGREEDSSSGVPTRIEIDEPAVREAIGTGILSAAGPGRLGFGQASYAEFLSARWLAAGALSAEQRRGLLFSEDSGQARVVPQLHEVASWLASLSAEFHVELLRLDPMVLLRSEPGGLDATERERLVDALLVAIAGFEIDRWDRRIRGNYPALAHPGLAEQLRAVIGDGGADPQARQVACDIAGACGLGDLAPLLTALALDADCDGQVRIAALHALKGLAGPAERRALRPLALELVPEDTDDELKGGALEALWPEEIDVIELLGVLHAPRAPNLIGQYKAFIRSRIASELSPSDLPIALHWAARLLVQHHSTDPLTDLREELLVAAWPHLPEGGELFESYLDVVCRILEAHANLISRSRAEENPEVFHEPVRRRQLVGALIDRLQDGGLRLGDLVFSTPRLLAASDLDWLVGLLRGAVGGAREEPIAQLVERLPMFGVSEEALLEAREESPVLRRRTAHRYDAVALDSQAADEARREYAQLLELEREEQPEREVLDVPAGVTAAIERFEAGESDGFWIAVNWLEYEADGGGRGYFVSDLRALAGWEAIDATLRKRVLAAAARYLTVGSPAAENWFGKNTFYHPAWAGYRALRAVSDIRPELLQAPAAWERWAPIIVAWPRDGAAKTEEVEFSDRAVAQLCAHAPTKAAHWLGRMLDHELRRAASPTVLGRFEGVWNPELEAAVLKRARRSGLDPAKRTWLLRFLIAGGSVEALGHARRLVSAAAVRAGGRRLRLAVEVAAMLAAERGGEEWPRLWALMGADEDFGVALVEALAGAETQVAADLPADQGAALWSWVQARYPGREDPRIEGAHSPGLRELIGDWRSRMLNAIAGQGSREAALALGRLAAENPELPGILRLKRETEESHRRLEWEPPSPAEVLQLADDSSRRYVRSARDLRNVLVSSLGRAQTKLSGRSAQASLLWNTDPLRPKPERQVALWLEGHLQADLGERGIFVGREFEVRAHPKGYMGESVDLLAVAVAGPEVEGSEMVSVTIELKCCWHADRDRAMREQLVGRYLDTDEDQGIYLFAHFDSEKWDHADSRRSICRRRGVEESRSFYEIQAEEVSAEGLAEVSVFVLDCRPEANS